MIDLFTDSGATFSPCGCYRTALWRIWDPGSAPLMFTLLNPSTADDLADDPTVTRCRRRAQAGGFGGLVITNAFALRSTDPQALFGAPDPVGPGNDDAILEFAGRAGLVVCGWGEHCDRVRPGRSVVVLDLIRAAGKVPHALAVNAGGAPKHPLYCSYELQPMPL
ncbi:DUF1643 domain-containing protein [Mycobacterium sp. KBS0706]|uniref:DUF1643 domain-containing protein n=1 Tax=Mycobacterium sp. KBS0706 TaxID=2578109 RepID=UPI00110FA078|nr:DUF1643 domain-containing protein [Mycobacterium sp. KBS0706]TSD89107.1 DUF1643 domain-containing protein [Mycobacterium sp. KBS0706]